MTLQRISSLNQYALFATVTFISSRMGIKYLFRLKSLALIKATSFNLRFVGPTFQDGWRSLNILHWLTTIVVTASQYVLLLLWSSRTRSVFSASFSFLFPLSSPSYNSVILTHVYTIKNSFQVIWFLWIVLVSSACRFFVHPENIYTSYRLSKWKVLCTLC